MEFLKDKLSIWSWKVGVAVLKFQAVEEVLL